MTPPRGDADEALLPWPYRGREPDKAFLYEIVANKRNGIDVDKLDYFQRDCRAMGLSHTYDFSRLMAFARVLCVDGRRQICYPDKVRSALRRGAAEAPAAHG